MAQLDPTPALEQAVFRTFLARERYDAGAHVVRALLTAWSAEPAPAAEARGLVDRLVHALQGRSPLALNENMTVLAVDGAFASVIGGTPAAAVVFSRQVDARTAADPRVAALEARVAAAADPDRE